MKSVLLALFIIAGVEALAINCILTQFTDLAIPLCSFIAISVVGIEVIAGVALLKKLGWR